MKKGLSIFLLLLTFVLPLSVFAQGGTLGTYCSAALPCAAPYTCVLGQCKYTGTNTNIKIDTGPSVSTEPKSDGTINNVPGLYSNSTYDQIMQLEGNAPAQITCGNADIGFVSIVCLPFLVKYDTIGTLLNGIFQLAIAFGAIAAVLMLVIGGFQYMTQDAVGGQKEARARIQGAVLGLILLLLSYLILFVINPEILKSIDTFETRLHESQSTQTQTQPTGFGVQRALTPGIVGSGNRADCGLGTDWDANIGECVLDNCPAAIRNGQILNRQIDIICCGEQNCSVQDVGVAQGGNASGVFMCSCSL